MQGNEQARKKTMDEQRALTICLDAMFDSLLSTCSRGKLAIVQASSNQGSIHVVEPLLLRTEVLAQSH